MDAIAISSVNVLIKSILLKVFYSIPNFFNLPPIVEIGGILEPHIQDTMCANFSKNPPPQNSFKRLFGLKISVD